MEEPNKLTDRELEEWYRHATTRDDERTIGSQSRDRKIRRLIEELRHERSSPPRTPDAGPGVARRTVVPDEG